MRMKAIWREKGKIPLKDNLDSRTGLPEDLRVLLARYPREHWQGHENLGQLTRFWLDRHNMFRELGASLKSKLADFREEKIQAPEFGSWFAPRLQFFLQQLEAHHHIEDDSYFPVFRAAEQKLAKGFDILENDHEIIHASILDSVQAANTFLQSLSGDADKMKAAADDYSGTNEKLLKQLLRHLDDEEDLIVPLILDQGERKLDVG